MVGRKIAILQYEKFFVCAETKIPLETKQDILCFSRFMEDDCNKIAAEFEIPPIYVNEMSTRKNQVQDGIARRRNNKEKYCNVMHVLSYI